MTDEQRAHSVGATGGLPGANAAPATSEVPADDLDDTVATGAAFESTEEADEGPIDDAEAVRRARVGGYLEES